VKNLTEMSNIQLELELTRQSNFQYNFEKLYKKLQSICEEEADLSIEDLIEHIKLSSLKVARIKNEVHLRKKPRLVRIPDTQL
jgi:hypothetical protein